MYASEEAPDGTGRRELSGESEARARQERGEAARGWLTDWYCERGHRHTGGDPVLHLPWIAAHTAAAAAALTCTDLSEGAGLRGGRGPFPPTDIGEGRSFRGERQGGRSFWRRAKREESLPLEKGEGGVPVVKSDAVILRLWGGVRIPLSEGWS